MNSNGGHFDRFLKKSKKVKKYSENEILWHGVVLCVLVARKNDKLEFDKVYKKLLHKKCHF